MPNVLILAERRDEGLHPISFELIGASRKIVQDQGGKIDVALLGHKTGGLAEELLSTGVNKVHIVDDPLLNDYTTEAYVAAAAKLIDLTNPEIVLIGQTSMGRDLAPRLAFRVKGAVAMDCLGLKLDSATGALVVTRPIYGGSLMATYRFGKDAKPQILTIRSKAFEPAEPEAEADGQITEHAADLNASQIRTRTLEKTSLVKAG